MGAPNQRLVIDLCGPYPVSNGYRYIFTAIDPYTKFVTAVGIRNKEASTIARVLVKNVFLVWSQYFELLSDLGKEFENEIVSELCSLLGMRKIRSSGYRPQTSGVIETWHRVLHSMMAKLVSSHQKDWSDCLGYVVFCYNASVHRSTGYSPFFLMTGREAVWNVDLLLPGNQADRPPPEFVRDVRERLQLAHAVVQETLQRSAEAASTWYNRKVKYQEFSVGDRVRVYWPRRFRGRTPKWQNFFENIGQVTERLNDATYVVKLDRGGVKKIFHTDKLKLVK